MTNNHTVFQFEITKAIVLEYRRTLDKWLFCHHLLGSYEMDDSDEAIEQLECILEDTKVSTLTK